MQVTINRLYRCRFWSLFSIHFNTHTHTHGRASLNSHRTKQNSDDQLWSMPSTRCRLNGLVRAVLSLLFFSISFPFFVRPRATNQTGTRNSGVVISFDLVR